MTKFRILVSCLIFFAGIISVNTIYSDNETPENKNDSYFSQLIKAMKSQSTTPKKSVPFAQDAKKKTVIFDLDGVVVRTDKSKAFQAIGVINTLKYIIRLQKLPDETALFDALECGNDLAKSINPAYNKGKRLPQLIVDWQCQLQSNADLQIYMNQAIDRYSTIEIERIVLKSVVNMMMRPEIIIPTRTLIEDGVTLLHELKDKGYKLLAFSNWDAESFPLMKESHPEIFMHNDEETFDGIMISGEEHMLKPDTCFFDLFFENFHEIKENCIFLDDTIQNVQASIEYGLDAIHCNPQDIATAREQLIQGL